MVWANARTQNCAPTRSLWVEGMRRGTAGCARPDFLPSHSDRAQPPRNTTSHMLQRGFTATSGWCWAALYGVDCLSLRAARAVSLCLPHVTSRDVSASGAIIAASAANHRRLCQQRSVHKARVSLVELGRIASLFQEHLKKNPNKKFLVCRLCATAQNIQKQSNEIL